MKPLVIKSFTLDRDVLRPDPGPRAPSAFRDFEIAGTFTVDPADAVALAAHARFHSSVASGPDRTAFHLYSMAELARLQGFHVQTESPPCRSFSTVARDVPVLDVTFTDKKRDTE